MFGLQTLRAEMRPTLRLAIPLVLAELGWMSMAIVDTMMVGRLPNSATAIGAVSLGSNIFIVLALFGGGLLMGLDTLVAQAFGAGQREDCHRSLVNSIYLSIALTPFLSAAVWSLPFLLGRMHIDPAVLALTIPYTKALAAGLLPLLLYFAVRRCLQAMNMVKPVAFALVSANIINALGNLILVYGKWGVPAMGTVGSGWSTAISRLYLASVVVGYLLWYDRKHRTELLRTPIDIDLPRIRRLITLGLPAAMQFTLESGVFALATALIARLGAVPLASHQIALNTVAFTYMVPLGIASAAAVRVGQAIGRGDPRAAGDAGGTAIFLGASFMTSASAGLLVFPRWIARMYTPDEIVIHSTIALLAAGAAFQLFDGIQTVATGALRGAGDTRTPMFCHFTAYWVIGLPLGAWLCFRKGWGAFGLWSGLSLALILIGIVLLFVWRRAVRRLIVIPAEVLVRN
jgi:multidrug resistance protein, MATE family